MGNLSKRQLYNLLEIIDGWERRTDANKFEDTFKTILSLLPYKMSLCAIGNAKFLTVDKLITRKFPADYLQIYFAKKMIQIDPFIKNSLFLRKAHFWDIENYRNRDKYKEIISLNKDFELTQCLGTAFSESNGKTTFLSLVNAVEKPHQHHLQIVDFLMPHLHHTINRIYGSQNGNGNLNPLTHRELEVLKWIPEGKTNWEISQIMGISEATVKFHLLNIFKKLNVINRGHAVAKALHMEILDYNSQV